MYNYDAHIQQTIKSSAGILRDVLLIHKQSDKLFASHLIAGCIPMSEIAADNPFWELELDRSAPKGDSATLARRWLVTPKDIPNVGQLSIEDRLRISRLIFLHTMIIPEKYPTVSYLDSNDGNYELHAEWNVSCNITTPQHLNATWSREIPLDEDSNEKPLSELMHEVSQPVMLMRRMPAARVEVFGKNIKLIVTGLDLDFIQAFSLYQNYVEANERKMKPV